MNLVYDRTAQDVETARTQRGTTLTPLKGCYNITDLNRVESAIKLLAAELTSAGYPVEVTPVLKGSSRVPAGYTEVEWIQSSGTQYIDTGVSTPEGCRVQCKVAYTSLSSTLAVVFGSHDAAPPYYRNFLAATSSIWELGAYGTADFGSPAVNTEYEIDANTKSGEIACTVNGTAYSINQSIAPSAQRSALSVYLFAIHYADGLFPAKMKAWWYKVYVGGTLVRDFIPCKNPAGVVGLYDLVGGEFYTTPLATEPVNLPDGYTQLAYLQSTGTQYIDSGLKGDSDVRVTVDFEITDFGSGTTFIFGAQGTDSVRYTLGMTSAGAFRSDFGTAMTSGSAASLNTRFSADKNGNICTVGGQTLTSAAATFTGTTNIYLFARSYSSVSCSKIKMYRCQMYKIGTLVRDFVPARNSSGTLGLYDAVNGTFYTNAGTGTFTAGADIVGFTAGADVSPYEDREWQEGDVLRRPQWATYLENVRRLRAAYYTLAETGAIPKADDVLTWEGANNIEKVLADIDLLIGWMKSSYRRCGTFNSGENSTTLPLKGSV